MLYTGGNGIWCHSPPGEADKALYVVGLYRLPYVLYADGNMICSMKGGRYVGEVCSVLACGARGQGILAARRDLDLERRASYGDGKTIVEEWSFNLENALESHTKAKHSAGK
ncbi:hypothetical protein ACSBR2_029027 [Camellia fascicularis]